jgi:hypothetical protein
VEVLVFCEDAQVGDAAEQELLAIGSCGIADVIFCEEEVVVKQVDRAYRPRVYCRAHNWDNLSDCFKNLDVLDWPNRYQKLA